MHFRTLGVIYVPEMEDDPVVDQQIAQEIEDMEKIPVNGLVSIIRNIRIKELKNKRDAFSRQVSYEIDSLMEPYDQNTENPAYLVFEDHTEELKQDFEASADCIRLPDGRIMEATDYHYCRGLIIKDGAVYAKKAGPLKHIKKTRKSRKYKALPAYPRKKVYKDFKDYAENWRGYDFDEDHQGYGYNCNPDGMWDWFVIGGRWPTTFLVKDDCKECSLGEHDYQDPEDAATAPEGYRWVSAARKKDIQWDMMRQWHTEQITKQFLAMQTAFDTGSELSDHWFRRCADGFYSFDGCAYLAGDTLEQHLAKHDIPADWKYPVSFADIVTEDGWEGEFKEFRKSKTLEGIEEMLRRVTDETIDNCDDDAVLVSIDYHT